jgi:hypothetical protein
MNISWPLVVFIYWVAGTYLTIQYVRKDQDISVGLLMMILVAAFIAPPVFLCELLLSSKIMDKIVISKASKK